jgi:hypothetical protein
MSIGHASVFERLRQSWHRSMGRKERTNELADGTANEAHQASNLLTQRLCLLGLDTEYVRHCKPALFRDLAHTCASCRATRQCARDLARRDVQAGMSAYCPNGPSIDLLMVRCTNTKSLRLRYKMDDTPV